jgi:nucleoside-diphosphate-sugar epimerase
MKLFLTGGSGFIGSHLLRVLAKTSHQVVALRRSAASRPSIDICIEPVWLEKPMNQLDATDFVGVDVLVHLASVGVSPKTASWQELFHWNVQVMIDLLEKAHTAGVKRFVLAGSYAEYGLTADQYERIPTDAALLPTSPYAASKAAGFIAAHTYAVEKQIELCYLRIFSAFGEGQFPNNFWPALRCAALNGEDFPMTPGEQVRDFVPVEQVANDILRVVEDCSIVQPGVPYVANIGSGEPVSMLQFAKRWWSQWDARGRILAGATPYRPNEPMRYVPQIVMEVKK